MASWLTLYAMPTNTIERKNNNNNHKKKQKTWQGRGSRNCNSPIATSLGMLSFQGQKIKGKI